MERQLEEQTKQYLISGRVQGVGFRRFTERAAQTLQLRGWVRNLADGRVEAMARGPVEALKRFEAELKKGPAHGHVESIVINSIVKPESWNGFELRKDGSEPWSEK